jgi:hypothetical protein
MRRKIGQVLLAGLLLCPVAAVGVLCAPDYRAGVIVGYVVLAVLMGASA